MEKILLPTITRRKAVGSLACLLASAAGLAAFPAVAVAEEYVIQPGDTLYGLALSRGTTVDAIARANNVIDPNMILAGHRLTIPDSASHPPPATPTPAATTQPAVAQTPTAATPPPVTGRLLGQTRVVTYYGNPWSPYMGILGELEPAVLVSRLKALAAEYERIDGKPTIAAIELIAVVAQADAGYDGAYRMRMPADEISRMSKLAADNGMLLILDIQVGRSTVAREIDYVLPFLRDRHVHLAIDPEFQMWGSERPGIELGHTVAADINRAQTVLADIVGAGDHQKILIVHQFTPSMISDKAAIVAEPRVDLAIVMDGFGGREAKIGGYRRYIGDDRAEFGGIKLFYRYDVNLLTPADVVAISPSPNVVIYQ